MSPVRGGPDLPGKGPTAGSPLFRHAPPVPALPEQAARAEAHPQPAPSHAGGPGMVRSTATTIASWADQLQLKLCTRPVSSVQRAVASRIEVAVDTGYRRQHVEPDPEGDDKLRSLSVLHRDELRRFRTHLADLVDVRRPTVPSAQSILSCRRAVASDMRSMVRRIPHDVDLDVVDARHPITALSRVVSQRIAYAAARRRHRHGVDLDSARGVETNRRSPHSSRPDRARRCRPGSRVIDRAERRTRTSSQGALGRISAVVVASSMPEGASASPPSSRSSDPISVRTVMLPPSCWTTSTSPPGQQHHLPAGNRGGHGRATGGPGSQPLGHDRDLHGAGVQPGAQVIAERFGRDGSTTSAATRRSTWPGPGRSGCPDSAGKQGVVVESMATVAPWQRTSSAKISSCGRVWPGRWVSNQVRVDWAASVPTVP